MSKTCMQTSIVRRGPRSGQLALRRMPHIVPHGTGDSNNGYALCEACGQEVYVGSGLHPNLGVPISQVDAEAAYMRSMR